MSALLADLRIALRALLRAPGFALATILTLALGVGGNAALVGLLRGTIAAPLPYRDADAVVQIRHFYPSLNALEASVSPGGFREYLAMPELRGQVGAARWAPANLSGIGDGPQRLLGLAVLGDYFGALGTPALLGRAIQPDDITAGRRVVVLSHTAWRDRFGADAGIVGRTVRLDGVAAEVIGVMPEGFRDPESNVAIWMPLLLSPAEAGSFDSEYLEVVARLPRGLTVDALNAALARRGAAIRAARPEVFPDDWRPLARDLVTDTRRGSAPMLLLLAGAGTLVLLLAGVNAGHLALARGLARRDSLAVRAALGAGHGALLRPLLAEAVWLVAGGTAAGLAAAWIVVRAAQGLLGPGRWHVATPELLRASGLAAALAALVLLAGYAWLAERQLRGVRGASTLARSARGAGVHGIARGTRRWLVATQVAFAVGLLGTTTLLARGIARLGERSPGFTADRVVGFELALPAAAYPDTAARRVVVTRLRERLAALPGVAAVGVSDGLPFSGELSTVNYSIEGYTAPPDTPEPWGDIKRATPGFLEALDVPLLAGRGFTEADASGERVAIVDAGLSQRYYGSPTGALGRRVRIGSDSTNPWMRVVGVVGTVQTDRLDGTPRIQVYVPLMRRVPSELRVVLRVRGTAPMAIAGAVRAAVREVDAELPVAGLRTLAENVQASMGQQTRTRDLLAAFAALAMLLSVVGVYGVTAFALRQRTGEFGIRLALGATPRDLEHGALRDEGRPTLAGALAGLLLVAAALQVARSLVPGLGTADAPWALAAAVLVTGAALAAAWLPARRVARTDPMTALRAE